MRADSTVDLSEPQRRIAAYDGDAPLCVNGPPGSGKTTALAARASALRGAGPVAVICPNDASCEAFRASMDRAGGTRRVVVETLAGHFASWMRADFVSSGASPDLIVGSDVDSAALARAAGRCVLDMSWQGFRGPDFTLDLPFLGRPDRFFEEAAALFRQLRRWAVTPDEFESRTSAGVAAFYGGDVERARALCADPQARSRASSRGRDALNADAGRLRTQKRAENELAKLLAYLYGEYRAAARGARVLCKEDVADEGLHWLRRDAAARVRIARRFAGVIVDDAEDSEPATAALIDLVLRDGARNVTIASCESGAIDGIGGRRALNLGGRGQRIDLPPRAVARETAPAARYRDESAEADAIAMRICGLLAGGARPSDIMLLARDADGAAVYARLLAERDVPITASPAAWQSPREVADLLALACIVDDPYDHAHLLRVLASPLVGLSDLSMLTLCRDPIDAAQLSLDVVDGDRRVGGGRGVVTSTLADNVMYGAADLRLSEDARVSVVGFRKRWGEWRGKCARMSPAAAIAFLIRAAGFAAAWHAAPAHLRARLAEDGRRLVAAAARVGAGGLRETARCIQGGFGWIAAASDSDDAVACRTIVGAKGVRKPYVFVAGVAHERFPRVYVSRAMAYSKRFGLIVRENVAGGAAQTAKFAWYYAKHGAKARYLEEERRALEYALSRADAQAHATGYGKPPRWAADHDLLAAHGA